MRVPGTVHPEQGDGASQGSTSDNWRWSSWSNSHDGTSETQSARAQTWMQGRMARSAEDEVPSPGYECSVASAANASVFV